MENMNVISFASTGHVLGVVTRTAQADTPPTVEQISPNGIRLRNIRGENLRTTIGANQLAVTQVPYDTRVIYSPQLFAIDEGRAEEQISFSPPAGPTATLDGTNVAVTLPAAVSSDTKVFVHISGGALSEAVARSLTVPDGITISSESLSLAAGDYMIAIFAPGYATVLIAESVV